VRILFIHQVGGRGGAGVMLLNIIAALDRQETEPMVVCPAGDMVEALKRQSVTVRVAPRPIRQFTHISGYSYPAFHPAFVRGAVGLLRDRQFWCDYIRSSGADIVHLNALTLSPMASSVRAAGAKAVCLVQETAVRGLLGLRTAWLRRLLSAQMDAVAFISEYDRQRARCTAPIVEVTPNWVNLADYDLAPSRHDARRALGLPADGKVVLMMGGVSRLKGTLTLMRAAEHLGDVDGLVVLVAGDTRSSPGDPLTRLRRAHIGLRRLARIDYPDQVERALSRGDVRQRVRFIGMQSDVLPLYAAADVVVFPATAPHQARPVIEAGAMRKPVVVSDFPNVREFVQDGVNGLAVPPGDAGKLADAIRALLEDRSLADRLGEANYDTTREHHNADINGPRFVSIYRRVMGSA